jgi:hypothetical protein
MAKSQPVSISQIMSAHERGLIDDRERQILLMRIPPIDGKRLTQAAIGETLGISGAWVCQLESRARIAIERATDLNERVGEIAVIAQPVDSEPAPQSTKRRSWLSRWRLTR